MKLMNLFLWSSALLLFSIPLVTAGQTSKSIFFSAGKNSATVSGTVRGHAYIDYKLNVQAGQILNVTLNSKSTSVFFNVLPPGSQDVAIYNSSEGENKFTGVAEKSGLYAIRVYLMGAAKSENQSVNFALTVGLVKPQPTPDANPEFTATGQIRSSKGRAAEGSVLSDFGVIRHGFNDADVYVTFPGSSQKILRIKNGKWKCLSANCTVTYAKKGDDWFVNVNGIYHFIIPDAVVNGG